MKISINDNHGTEETINIENWFCNQDADSMNFFQPHQEYTKTQETEKAIKIESKDDFFWIPKSLIN